MSTVLPPGDSVWVTLAIGCVEAFHPHPRYGETTLRALLCMWRHYDRLTDEQVDQVVNHFVTAEPERCPRCGVTADDIMADCCSYWDGRRAAAAAAGPGVDGDPHRDRVARLLAAGMSPREAARAAERLRTVADLADVAANGGGGPQ